MKLILKALVILLLIIVGCRSIKEDIILNEKDLIPEGVAYNSKNGSTYISSIYKQKILEITKDGLVGDLIDKKLFNNLSPLGIEMDNISKTLWVCTATAPIINHANLKKWQTWVLAINVDTKSIVSEYNLDTASKGTFFNDITVASNGDVYITESVGGKIYVINNRTNKLELFVKLEDNSFPNGIVYYKPFNCLFVATNQGIIKIDITTKIVSIIKADNINAKSIDGLAVYDNYFIGHQSSKVSRFYLNEDFTKILKAEILDSGNEFDSSTTGEIGNKYYHFIVNSQQQSGIDRTNTSPKIKPLDSLEPVIIRKIKL